MNAPPGEIINKAAKKDKKKKNMQQINVMLTLSMAVRQRAAESIIQDVLILDNSAELITGLDKIGQVWNEQLQQSRSKKQKFNPKVPIHIIMFCSAMDYFAGVPQLQADFGPYVKSCRQDTEGLSDEVKYFRKIRCFDKSKAKLITSFKVGSGAEARWRVAEQWLKTQLVN